MSFISLGNAYSRLDKADSFSFRSQLTTRYRSTPRLRESVGMADLVRLDKPHTARKPHVVFDDSQTPQSK